MRNTIRFILGYVVGIGFFLLLIPFGLQELAGYERHVRNFRFLDRAEVRWAIALPVFILGLVFAVWSNWALYKIGKGGPTDAFGLALSPRTKKLVIAGPYRFTRNPMVFGALCLYASLAVFLNSMLCLACLLAVFPLVIVYLKATEEKRLLKDFGSDYIDYRRRVSMVFPIKKR